MGSFSEAEGYCNSIWDAHLASIHSAGENQFIYDSYGGQAGGDIWIGGKRQGDSFAWLDGTPWDYQNWSPNNPSHRHEECAEIFALNYYPSNWNDDSCSSRNAFVCQLTPAKGGPTTLPPRNCPKGWEGFQNSCYLYENETKTWEAARRHCIDLKADLVNIQSGEENDFISNFYSGAVYWIGLRRNETNSDSFVWTDGTAMTYSNWQSGQPDNWGTEEEECVVTGYLGPSFWNDVDASTGEKLQDRKLSLSGVEDEKCSTDADCKKNCASGYICSCNKGTYENNKGEKTLRVLWGHNLLHGSGIAGGTYGEGYANSNFGNGIGHWGCSPPKCKAASGQCCFAQKNWRGTVCPRSC